MTIKQSLQSLVSKGENLFANTKYGDLGFFSKRNKQTTKYIFANWGSRRWEYFYVENLLSKIGIEGKKVVDIGIGRPIDADFYKFYVQSGCYLTGIDPDQRLKKVTKLSGKCKIIRCSGDRIPMEDQSVDVVVALSVFEHFSLGVFKKTVKEIHRILKNDGHLIITLDTTVVDHRKSARWAILEKTMNGLSDQENDSPLPKNGKSLSLKRFLKFLSPYFVLWGKTITNVGEPPEKLVYSSEWNSCVAYMHLYKRNEK